MNQEIPQDLAGYQNIVCGTIEPGDILVSRHGRIKIWAKNSIGELISGNYFDVYRKIPCPKAGDHDKGWQEVRDNVVSSNGKWCGSPMPDGQTFWVPNVGQAETNKAKTDDSQKPPLAHLPWKALREVSFVQAYGKDKYGDFHNYRKGMEISRNLSCAVRHIADFMDGQDNDEETKRSHLASAATRILFALQNHLEGTSTDDRYKKQ